MTKQINLNICFILATFILLVSCSFNKFKTHSSGLQYRFIIQNNDSAMPKSGNIVQIKMKYYSEDDSLLFNSDEENRPMKLQVIRPSHEGGSLEDALLMLHKGDSAVFLIDAQNFYEKTRSSIVPQNIAKESKLRFNIKLINIQTFEEIEQERNTLRMANEEEEMTLLQDYLKTANITIKPSASGLYYIEKVKGKGKKAEAGKTMVVHYTGSFIDGKIFDSSLRRNEPFEFELGKGIVIEGWDEGIANMREGGKAMLIIPSKISYGDKGKGPVPPYSTLVFEVELLQVK